MSTDPSAPRVDTLLMHGDDNVLLAVTDLPAGYTIRLHQEALVLPSAINSGHKLARRAIAAGELILKYGQPIGRATATIPAGEHVHVHNVESLRGRGDTEGWRHGDGETQKYSSIQVSRPGVEASVGFAVRPSSSGTLSSLPPTFLGYRRHNGRVGVRNHVLVLATVQCANGVVRHIAQLAPGVVPLTHVYGCSQLGADLTQTTRVLEGFASHPNVAAVLLIGLGCESLDSAGLAERLAAAGVVLRRLTIQEAGGTGATAEQGAAMARELLAAAAQAQRVPILLSELILGLECGGSDAWSGLTANPALGIASDRTVAAGGTVLLSEIPEFIGAEELLAARATPELAEAIRAAVYRWEDAAQRMGVDMRGAQPTPGNIAGGLTTIEEKSLGAITKGGSSPVRALVGYACQPPCCGLVLMDTPGNDAESVTGMVAGGAQVVAFTTGRGTPLGCPIAPVIKIATNSGLARRMTDDVDLDAGTVISAGESLEAVGARILAEVLAVASGKETAAEHWGHGEFAIHTIGPRV